MSNQFISLVKEAHKNKWCVNIGCTTCGNQDFRLNLFNQYTGILSRKYHTFTGNEGLIDDLDSRYERTRFNLPNLINDLTTLDINELMTIPIGGNCVSLVFLYWDYPFPSPRQGPPPYKLLIPDRERETILKKWLPKIRDNLRFADCVLFYVVRNYRQCSQIADKWINECVLAATETKDISLVESLIRVLGRKSSRYPELLKIAINMSKDNRLVHNALAKADFMLPYDEQKKKIKESRRAAKNIFGAIRRNDLKAVSALLQKISDLSVKNKKNQALIQYAGSSGNKQIIELLHSKMLQNSRDSDC